jgi:HD-GYP domain-containing protein (c-di-GMP phosphodiesterase class II)
MGRDAPSLVEPPLAPLLDVVLGLHRTIGLVDERQAEHGTLVASLATHLGQALGCDQALLEALLLAGVLHDVGGLAGELDGPELEAAPGATLHPEQGYRLLAGIAPLGRVAGLVRHHHRWWCHGEALAADGAPVPEAAFIVHLADAVARRLARGDAANELDDGLPVALRAAAGTRFAPAHVEAFLDTALGAGFWSARVAGAREAVRRDGLRVGRVPADRDLTLALGQAFARIIDLRSRYTALHSIGVGLVAADLAAAAGWSPERAQELQLAGYLHDLGKIAIPDAVLEKRGPLDESELRLVRAHPALSGQALAGLPGFERIAVWTAQHHERLDGRGYPAGTPAPAIEEGSRLLAVADVYTALSEDRPYRARLARRPVLRLLDRMVVEGALDPDAVSLLVGDIDRVEFIAREARGALD